MSEQQITIKKQRLRFTQIPNELLCSNKISGVAKALWCVLYSKPENWIFYWSEISQNFAEGREALMNARRKLEEAGYIKIIQKRIPTGRGNETKYGGMDIELFHTPSLPLDLDSEGSSQITGFPTSGFPLSGNQDSGSQTSGNEISGNQLLKRDKSKQDLSKKYLSSSSLPTFEEAKKFCEEEDLKIDVEEWLKFSKHEEIKNWKKAIIAWAKNPKNQKKSPLKTSDFSPVESPEILELRSKIKFFVGNSNKANLAQLFIGAPIEKSLFGFTIFVKDERALECREIFDNLNIVIQII